LCAEALEESSDVRVCIAERHFYNCDYLGKDENWVADTHPFHAVPDIAFNLHADPDPDQGLDFFKIIQ